MARIKGKRIGRSTLYKYLTRQDAAWVKYVYDETLYSKVILANLAASQIKSLYVFHHAADSTQEIPFKGIYKPLGISRPQYEKNYFTVGEVVRRLRPRYRKLFRTRKLAWFARMGKHHRNDIDMIRYPIVLRSLSTGGYEIIDGNRRIISKALKEGFSFKCRAYVLCFS